MKALKVFQEDLETKIRVLNTDENGYKIAEFTPSLKEFFYLNEYPFRKTFKQKLRFLFEYLQSHYKVFYLINSDDYIVGMCVAQNCGKGRYSFLDKSSYMIGPYIIESSYRGQGLAKKLISMVLNQFLPSASSYCWISKDNVASLRTAESLGGVAVNGIKINSITRRFKLGNIEYGDYLLYKFCKH